MKKLCCLLTVLALVLTAGVAEVTGNLLGLQVLSTMTDGTQNAAVSPLSLALALQMAQAGAQGETLEELDALLKGDNVDVQALMDAGLKSANAAFVSPDYPLNEEYKQMVDAEWFEMGDDTMERVNAWVSEKTGGLIEQLLEEPPSEETALYLVNAIAMEKAWISPFPEEDSYEDTFHAPNGEKQVNYMYAQKHYLYAERDGAQLIRLPYEDFSLAMYVALPEEGKVSELIAALCEEGFSYFDCMEETSEVKLSLPSFSLEYGGSLKEALQSLGMEISFTNRADFSLMGDEPLMIDDVIQKVRIDVDENGTKAAAATVVEAVLMGLLMDPPEPVEMTVNRPFVAIIADAQSGAIAFAAVVAEP